MKVSKNDFLFLVSVVVAALVIYLLLAGYLMISPPSLMFTFVLLPVIFILLSTWAALHVRKYNFAVGIGVFLLLGLLEYSLIFLPPQMFAEVIECTITGDDSALTTGLIKSSRNGNLKYIYTDYGSEGEPFKNVDSMAFFKTNSLSVQGQAKKFHGQKVKMKVYGIRFSPLSMTRNVIYIMPIADQE